MNAGLPERRAQRRADRYRLLMRKAADGYVPGALAVQNNGWHTDLTIHQLIAYAADLLERGLLDPGPLVQQPPSGI